MFSMSQEELLKKMQEFQMLQQQLQTLVMQRQAINQQLSELEEALEEVEKTSGKVFKIIGEVFVEKEKEVLIEELKSKKELLEIKLNSLVKHEDVIKEKLIKLQEELNELAKLTHNVYTNEKGKVE